MSTVSTASASETPPATEAGPGPTQPSTKKRSGKSVGKRVLDQFRPSNRRGLIALIVFLIFWHLMSKYVVDNTLFLTGPVDVWKAEWRAWHRGELQHDLFISGKEFVKGFIPSVIFGILLGLLVGTSDRVKGYADPILNALYATPFIALAPLFILWFGIGETKTVVLVMSLSFLPVTINTDAGIRSVDNQLLEAARAFGAGRIELFRKVRVPGALPLIITGIRIAIGRGLIAVVVGELFGSQAGVGYRILISSQTFETSALLGGVVIFAIAGVVLVYLMQFIERKIAPWRAVQQQRAGGVVTVQ
jgi:NitT/TauT family transport system permease protein